MLVAIVAPPVILWGCLSVLVLTAVIQYFDEDKDNASEDATGYHKEDPLEVLQAETFGKVLAKEILTRRMIIPDP